MFAFFIYEILVNIIKILKEGVLFLNKIKIINILNGQTSSTNSYFKKKLKRNVRYLLIL